MKNEEYYMNQALKEAKKAYKKGEVPIGTVIVQNNKIVARAHNNVEKENNSLCHAELIVIRKASKKLNKWRLNDCTIYVTVEPCMMCCGAIMQSRISKIVYGTKNEKFGFTSNLNRIEIISDICKLECQNIIKEFFKSKR